MARRRQGSHEKLFSISQILKNFFQFQFHKIEKKTKNENLIKRKIEKKRNTKKVISCDPCFSNRTPLDVLWYDFNSKYSAMKPSILKKSNKLSFAGFFLYSFVTTEKMSQKSFLFHSTCSATYAFSKYVPGVKVDFQSITYKYDK